MDRTFFEQELLNLVAVMVIDIENKTNDTIKREVSKRVRRLLNSAKQKALSQATTKEEYRLAYDELSKTCYTEYNKIIKQFDIQIDRMVPVSTDIYNTVSQYEEV